MNIAVVGLGHVGTALAVLLAARHKVYAFDCDTEKVALLEKGQLPCADAHTASFFASTKLDLHSTNDAWQAYQSVQLVIVAVSTDYDPDTNYFNTAAVESVIEQIQKANSAATIVIKSTVPVGFTQAMADQYSSARILFSPEFLREDHALEDNLHPSRIVVGVPHVEDARTRSVLELEARRFANLLQERAQDKDAAIFIMSSGEAEATKLFSNAYLAMRVAFFNELDTFAYMRGLDTEQIIEAISADSRIGAGYNNPSFGFGGYCLPKDTKQLLANFENVPQRLIAAVIEANQTRKDFMADTICAQAEQLKQEGHDVIVGVYRLAMKANSDNLRASSMIDLVAILRARGLSLLVYEPMLEEETLPYYEVTHDLDSFIKQSSIIVANRLHEDIAAVADKVFSRDLFHNG